MEKVSLVEEMATTSILSRVLGKMWSVIIATRRDISNNFFHKLKKYLEERKYHKPIEANVVNNKANEDEVADMLLASTNGGSLANYT